jgi:hypothetical protein
VQRGYGKHVLLFGNHISGGSININILRQLCILQGIKQVSNYVRFQIVVSDILGNKDSQV